MTLEEIKDIENTIDICILAHDEALRVHDKKMQLQAIEVMQYELNKIKENTIVIRTPIYVN